MFFLLLLIETHIVTSIEFTNHTCARDPKSCLSSNQKAHIDRLLPSLYLVPEVEDLPYACALFHPHTVPRENTCEPCEHKEFGCLPGHGRGSAWDEVCSFFCPSMSESSSSKPFSTSSSSSKACFRDPKSCLASKDVQHIGNLIRYLNVEYEDLPFVCYANFPRTVPVEFSCLPCDHSVYGCRPSSRQNDDTPDGWEEVCAFFCPQLPSPNMSPHTSTSTTSPSINAETSFRLLSKQENKSLALSDVQRTGVRARSLEDTTTAEMNSVAETQGTEDYAPSDTTFSFPLVVWIELAFALLLGPGGVIVALYFGCCFRR